eukprot:TRINITY_DN11458_c0_g1_i1.p1 TRINITY_DN11458_c0_g1~~TRINITY_DN11458_c0_g1_i1.p1  ORF type:complete len:320 (+),score=108.27 TRINITY_DN11458_c0_g1_i1:62-1021(+)
MGHKSKKDKHDKKEKKAKKKHKSSRDKSEKHKSRDKDKDRDRYGEPEKHTPNSQGSGKRVTDPPSDFDFGPQLPPSVNANHIDTPESYGPQIPAPVVELQKEEEKKKIIYGPSFDLLVPLEPTEETPGDFVGPAPPSPSSSLIQDDSSDEEDIFGLRKKPKLSDSKKDAYKNPREEWMTAVPESNPLGFLGPRKFSKKGNFTLDRGDTSVWTDTPAEKLEKLKNPKVKDDKVALEQSRKITESLKYMKDYENNHRSKSLIEHHIDESKKRKKEKGVDEMWRPFDRERDLQWNPVNPKKRTELLKQSRQLNNRFGSQNFL